MLFLSKEYRKLIKDINNTNKYEELALILDNLNTSSLSEEKINELKEVFLKKYKSINSDIFPYIIEYFYSKDTKLEFSIACFLLENLCNKVDFVTNLENIKISEERFFEFLPVICKIVMQNASGIADCMYMILLNNSDYYEKIDKKYKDEIVKSLYKIGMALDYIEKTKITPTKEMLVNIEIMVDVARLYNDPRILKFVERALDIDNIEVNLFAVCTLIYNNVPISDGYIEELAREDRTCKRFFRILREMNRLFRFPEEYLTQEHLARADMVHWLMHPAEIGDVPDKIELVQTFEKDDEVFYVYKFKSNREAFKDKDWMIGISGGYEKGVEATIDNSGFTFSDFEVFDKSKIMEESERIIEKIKEAWQKRAEKNS